MTLDTTIPLDYHPDSLVGDDLGPDLGKAKGALQRMYDTWSQINEADDAVSDKAALALRAQAAVARAARSVDSRIKDLKVAAERAKERLARTLASDEKETTAQEIRQHFKYNEQPGLAVQDALQKGDIRSIKAVFEGPAFLSGLTQDQYESVREVALRKFAPEEFARVEQYGTAIAKLERASDQFTRVNAERIRGWSKRHEKKALRKLEVGE